MKATKCPLDMDSAMTADVALPQKRFYSPMIALTALIAATIEASLSTAITALSIACQLEFFSGQIDLQVILFITMFLLAIPVAVSILIMTSTILSRPTLRQCTIIYVSCLIAYFASVMGSYALSSVIEQFQGILGIVPSDNESSQITIAISLITRLIFFWLPIGFGLHLTYRPRMPYMPVIGISLSSICLFPFWQDSNSSGNIYHDLIVECLYSLPGHWLQMIVIGLILNYYAPIILNIQHSEVPSSTER